MPHDFQIRLLGSFSATAQGSPVESLDSAKLQRLIAYLVVHRGRPQQRSKLAFLFWPDSSEKQALTNLRNQLHSLRRALPEADRLLKVETKTLTWLEDSSTEIDLIAFDRHLTEAEDQSQKGDTESAAKSLGEAVAIYGGDFLSGCYEDWADAERESFSRRYGEALEILIKHHEDRRAYSVAIDFARKLQRHEPTREATYATLIRLHLVAGDRSVAMKTYSDCAEALKRELGVEPGQNLRAIHERLQAGDELETSVNVSSMPKLDAPELALQGRRAEWSALKGAWEEAAKGTAKLAVLTGDPGIGKTRLAEELFTWANGQGARVARTRSYAAEGRLAFAPAANWLRSPALKPGLQKLEPVWRAEVARILPELHHTESEEEVPENRDDASQRHRLFEALSRSVLAAGGSTLLLLDDMQWTDQETLEWLRYILRFAPNAPLLLLGTIRVEEITPNSSIERLLLDLRRDGTVTEIPVGPMAADETALVAACVAGREFSESEIESLQAETEGNPLFIVESVRAGSSAVSDAPAAESGEMPPKVHAVITARLGQLSEVARSLAAIGAVVGREFSFEILESVQEVDDNTLADALDELWQRRIIKEIGSAGNYDFTHDKLREVSYHTISPPRRRILHRKVALALETLHARNLDEVSAQLSLHYEEAGQIEKAVEADERAAAAARTVFAFDEAIRFLGKGIQLVRKLPDSKVTELRLQMARGVCLTATDGYHSPTVRQTYERIIELCEEIGIPAEGPALRGLALNALSTGDFIRSRKLGHELLKHYEVVGEHILLVEGHYVIGVASFWLADFEISRENLQASLDHFRPEDLDKHITAYAQDPYAICLCRLAWALLHLGLPDKSDEVMNQCMEYLGEVNEPHTLAYVYSHSIHYFLDRRSPEDFEPMIERLGEHIRRHPLQLFWIHRQKLFKGLIQFRSGETTEGLAAMEQAVGQLSKGNRLALSQCLYWTAEASLQSGNAGKAKALIEQAFHHIEKSKEIYFTAELHRLEGRIALVDRGNKKVARERFQKALQVAKEFSNPIHALRAAMDLGELDHESGGTAKARKRLQEIYDRFDEGFDIPDLQDARARLEEWR